MYELPCKERSTRGIQYVPALMLESEELVYSGEDFSANHPNP